MLKRSEIIKKLEKAGFYPDKISIKKDQVTVKKGYFYRFGETAEHIAEMVKKAIPEAHILQAQDEWKVWPKNSYFIVKFLIR